MGGGASIAPGSSSPVPEQNLPVMEQSQEVAQLEILPKPVVAEIEDDESELTSITTLSAAFNRIRK
jgi:hypothetical protein